MASKRILIVDDSSFARRLLRRILEDGGFEVDEAGSGSEAVLKFIAGKPDAVLLDIVMSEMTGLETLAKIKQLDPAAVVIMATADIQEATKQQALGAGAAGVVNKPFNSNQVLSTTGAALAKPA
jgi:two-component system, chemotaxis family, chemotaxis protein CheY